MRGGGDGRRPVLVTGASSGIGRATVGLLAERGFRVLATVRREEDGRAVEALDPQVAAVRLNVTDGASIGRARVEVEERVGAAGLAGLVNNAGVGLASPLELLDSDELRAHLEVNVVGQHAVTRALLPALRRGTCAR